MNILLTNSALDILAGSELVVTELAREFKARGHGVTIFTLRAGELAAQLQNEGILVATNPGHIPADFDIIHGQHHLPTMIAMAALPNVPAIYYCHGFGPWEEKIPIHPRIQRYLCVAPRLRDWFQQVSKLPPEAVFVLPNWVDLRKFNRVRTLPENPEKAILFTNHCIKSDLNTIRKACSDCGLELTEIGRAFDNQIHDPEFILANYDIAFASGRSALEAASSGCAVIPFRDGKLAPMILPENFTESAERNFTVEPDVRKASVTEFVSQIRSYSAGLAQDITFKVRKNYGFEHSVDAMLGNYLSSIQSWQSRVQVPADERESIAMANYLHSLATHQSVQSKEAAEFADHLKSGWEKTKRKREALYEEFSKARRKLALVEKHLSRGLFRKGLLQKLEFGWNQIEQDHATKKS